MIGGIPRYKVVFCFLLYSSLQLPFLSATAHEEKSTIITPPSPSLVDPRSSPIVTSLPSVYVPYRTLQYHASPSSLSSPSSFVFMSSSSLSVGNSTNASVTPSPSASANNTNNNSSASDGPSNNSIIIYVVSRVGIGLLLAIALYMAIQRRRNQRPIILTNAEYIARITAHEAMVNSQHQQRLGLSNITNPALMATPDEVAEIINQATLEAVQLISLITTNSASSSSTTGSSSNDNKYIIVFVPQLYTTFDQPLPPTTTNTPNNPTNPNASTVITSNSNTMTSTPNPSATTSTATTTTVMIPSRNRKWIRGNVTTAWLKYRKQQQDTYIPPPVTIVQLPTSSSTAIDTTIPGTLEGDIDEGNNTTVENNRSTIPPTITSTTLPSSLPYCDSDTPNDPPSSAITITVQVPVVLRIIKPNGECLVCFEETQPLCLLGTCGHTVCTTCAKKMEKCPFCRRELETIDSMEDYRNSV